MSDGKRPNSLQRREFLSKLLFASSALTFAAFQEASAEKPKPKDEGWELPKDWKKSPKPQPTKTPPPGEPVPPLPPGKPLPPNPRGARKPPQLKGDVAPPTAGVPVPPKRRPSLKPKKH